MTVEGLAMLQGKRYLHAITEFAQHFGKPPDQLNAEHIRRYQICLIKEKKVSQPTLVQVVCALRFFYGDSVEGDRRFRKEGGQDSGMIPVSRRSEATLVL